MSLNGVVSAWRWIRRNILGGREIDQPDGVVVWPIVFWSVFGGVLMGCLLWGYRQVCQTRHTGVCKMVYEHPPWLLVPGIVASPALLLTWYWRTAHKQSDIKNTIDTLSQAKEELDFARSKHEHEKKKDEDALELAQRSQSLDRLSKAVEMLGKPEQELRIAGVLLLEDLGLERPSLARIIFNTLVIFIRINARPIRNTKIIKRDTQGIRLIPPQSRTTQTFPPISESVRAAIFAIPKLRASGGLGDAPVDLRGCSLNDADLRGVNLGGFDLTEAHADRADFTGAVFRNADVSRMTFREATLDATALAGAICDGKEINPPPGLVRMLASGEFRSVSDMVATLGA